MRLLTLLARTTTPGDRVTMALSGMAIVGLMLSTRGDPGQRGVIYRDNRPLMTLTLNQDQKKEVSGKLGAVTIQVEQGRIRLVEYNSPRLIGTRTGWIQEVGQISACVPCGILIKVEGARPKQPPTVEFDAVSQ
ncbi:MAG: hypothetical protein G8237_00740 [Magnetococcales bacterium]|nr:NusG domain II-containing protein [Magnetococcales bacterium]NGZ04864.1 hypothetical protein [Magnetococcales bacterium]